MILFAVNSDDRARRILELANDRIRANSLPRTDMFWVARFDPHSKRSIYDLCWRTFKGETRRVADSP